MSVVSAAPHVRAHQSFGRPQGLRALAAFAFCLALGALSLPREQTMLRGTSTSEPVVGTPAQILLLLWACGAGLVLLVQAARDERAASGGPAGLRARVTWALTTMVTGLAMPLLIPLRYALAEGRVRESMAEGPVALLYVAVGVVLVWLAIDALKPRHLGRHAGSVPRADQPSTRALADSPSGSNPRPSPAAGCARPNRALVGLMAFGAPAAVPQVGYTFRTSGPSVASALAGFPGPVARDGASARSLRESELAGPYRLLVVLLGLAPVIFLVVKLLSDALGW
jgi:hypothetical protein